MLFVSHTDDLVALGDDLFVPSVVTIRDTTTLEPENGGLTVEVEAVFSSFLGRYRAARVSVEAEGDPFEVGGSTLRAIRINEVLQEGLAQVVEFRLESGERWPFPLDASLASYVVKSGPSSTAAMEWVSRIYRLAQAVRMRPAKAVQDQLGLTVPTASVWIRRARDRGYLELAPTGGPDSDG